MPQEKRPNDPRLIDYGPGRPAIMRGAGVTDSERYLAQLADKSFLNLWSYSNVFIDKKSGHKGDGKELCDLLVVCGDHVLIFSDKSISWPSGDDNTLAWRRWYKRAILKSVKQIRGAERWIAEFPQRIFLDRRCTQPLPLHLPPLERRKVHGIVVALGAAEACKEYYGEGIGSFLIVPDIEGEAHWKGDDLHVFAIGDVDPEGSFIHILNDATLDIVMRELDTITDFTGYLKKKERLIRSGRLTAASGEEELVAYYMTHMNRKDEHDFTKPDGSDWGENDHIAIGTGFYTDLLSNAQYAAKKAADHISYVWDRLINAFTTHLLAGTTIVPDGQPIALSHHEEGVRHMALVPRYLRRHLGEGILGALQKGSTTDRFTRGLLPGPNSQSRDTGFFFMTLAPPKFQLDGGNDQYRVIRRNMLEAYALAILRKTPQLQRIVGIATEPPSKDRDFGSSEDLVMAEQPEWTDALLEELEGRKKAFNILQPHSYAQYPVQGSNEFPSVQQDPSEANPMKLNRAQRRARAAQMRR